jgi:hypothetical protein
MSGTSVPTRDVTETDDCRCRPALHVVARWSPATPSAPERFALDRRPEREVGKAGATPYMVPF